MDTIIGLLIILPIPVSALIPRRWLLPWLLLITQLVAAVWLVESRRQCLTCGSGTIEFLFSLEAPIIAVIVLARLVIFAKKSKEKHSTETSAAPLVSWALWAAGAAAALTVLCVKGWNRVLDSGLATHLAVAGLAIVWFRLTPLLWKNRPSLNTLGSPHPANAFRLAGTLMIIGMLAWSILVIPKVIWQAQATAHGQAYCLLANSAHGLVPARTYLDLSGFLLHASTNSRRHAQLSTGEARAPEWQYWSYGEGKFEHDVMGGVLSCNLQHDFAKSLSWFASAQAMDGDWQFWLGRGQWRIPAEFHGYASDAPPELSFYAQGDRFLPIDEVPVRTGADSWRQYGKRINVLLCTPKKLNSHLAVSSSGSKLESVGNVYGLEKQLTHWHPGQEPVFQYIEYDQTGQPSTWLLCKDEWDSCSHAFIREGLLISFHHSGQYFSQWRDMQDAVWRRLQSFAVSWPDLSPAACNP